MSYRKTIYLNFISSVKVLPLSEIQENTLKNPLLHQSKTYKSDTKNKILIDSKTDRTIIFIHCFLLNHNYFFFQHFFSVWQIELHVPPWEAFLHDTSGTFGLRFQMDVLVLPRNLYTYESNHVLP
jgi:hypothetical protein